MPHNSSDRPHGSWVSIVARQGDDMNASIATEAQTIVREAAGRSSGLTVKGQIRQAEINLGFAAGSWRVREAWYGRAGAFSAQAIRDLQDRYLKWRDRESSRLAAHQAARAARDLAILEKVRATHRTELALVERRIAAAKEALRLSPSDPDR